jgi:HlyD family secretion protein
MDSPSPPRPLRSRRRSRWPWILAFLTCAGGGYAWWHQTQNAKPVAVSYQTAKVTRGDVQKKVRASGVVNPLAKVEIGSQISGTIVSRNVDYNSKVKAGDILCKLDAATYDAAFAQADAERASAEAECQFQIKTVARKRQLLQDKLFPEADFDKAEADLKSAQARLLLAEARLKRAKVDLERCTIYAPMDGVIIDRTAEIGMTIAASFNAPKLFILANDLTKMQINAQVSEADIGQVQIGQKVTFTVDAYPEPFLGEVVQVRNFPMSEENVVNYDAIIAVNNPDLKLRPGMTGNTDIITAERKDTLRLANAALRFRPEGAEKPKAKSPTGTPTFDRTVYREAPAVGAPPTGVPITIGIADDIHTEIAVGLKEGDEIITLLKPMTGAAPAGGSPFGGGMGRR